MNPRGVSILLATLCSLWLTPTPDAQAQDQRRAGREGGQDHGGYPRGGYAGGGYGWGGYGFRQPSPPVYAGRSAPSDFQSQRLPPQPYRAAPYAGQRYPYRGQAYPAQGYPSQGYPSQGSGTAQYLGGNGPASGGWRNEQDEARQAVREGRHIPLGQAIQSVRRRTAGRELDANLEPGPNGRPVYRLRWAAADGRRIDYLVDAATGAVLSAEGGR